MFNEAFSSVSVKEIMEAERALIAGGLNLQEIQNLCTVHAEVFRGSIGEQEAGEVFARPGHPVQTLKQENVVLTSLVNDALLPDLAKYEAKPAPELLAKIKQELADLAQVDKHYTRKEISMFPLMTKYGITAPPQVMWGETMISGPGSRRPGRRLKRARQNFWPKRSSRRPRKSPK